MRCAFRPSLNSLIARVMCWVLLFGWMAAHAAAHEHAAGEAGHHHHHHDTAAGSLHGHEEGHDDEAPPGQQACKSLCDTAGALPLAALTTGPCVVLPAAVVPRVPRPDATALPAPPAIPIAFLRLTI